MLSWGDDPKREEPNCGDFRHGPDSSPRASDQHFPFPTIQRPQECNAGLQVCERLQFTSCKTPPKQKPGFIDHIYSGIGGRWEKGGASGQTSNLTSVMATPTANSCKSFASEGWSLFSTSVLNVLRIVHCYVCYKLLSTTVWGSESCLCGWMFCKVRSLKTRWQHSQSHWSGLRRLTWLSFASPAQTRVLSWGRQSQPHLGPNQGWGSWRYTATGKAIPKRFQKQKEKLESTSSMAADMQSGSTHDSCDDMEYICWITHRVFLTT